MQFSTTDRARARQCWCGWDPLTPSVIDYLLASAVCFLMLQVPVSTQIVWWMIRCIYDALARRVIGPPPEKGTESNDVDSFPCPQLMELLLTVAKKI